MEKICLKIQQINVKSIFLLINLNLDFKTQPTFLINLIMVILNAIMAELNIFKTIIILTIQVIAFKSA